MCLNFVILCILAITQVIGLPVSTIVQLMNFTHEKCPSMEMFMKFDPQYLRQFDTVDREFLNNQSLSKQNQNSMLCLMYLSVFEDLCRNIGETNYYEEIKAFGGNFKTNTIEEVCDSLGKITETVLPQSSLLKALRSKNGCFLLCNDFGNIYPLCSMTSVMLGFSRLLETENKTKALKPKVSSSSTKEIREPIVPKDKDQSENSNLPRVTTNVSASLPSMTLNNNVSTPNKTDKNMQIETQSSLAFNPHNKQDISENAQLNSKKFQSETQSGSIDNKDRSDTENKGDVGKLQNETLLANTSHTKMDLKPASNSTPVNQILPSSSAEQLPPSKLGSKTDVVVPNTQNRKDDSKNKHINEETEKEDPNDEERVEPSDMYENGDDDFGTMNEPPLKKADEKPKEDEVVDTNQNIDVNEQPPKSSEVKLKPVEVSKPLETDEDGSNLAANFQNQNIDDSDSYFFSYFMMVCVMFICAYVAYHNKQKILALVLEGRKGRRPSRTRRPNSANYRKLDTTLEEAVTSSCNKNTTQVIY